VESALREEICELGRRLYARNLVAATDGNLSARLDEDRFLCTPSGVSKGFMNPDDLLIADASGALVGGTGKVTSEFFTHLAAYEERADVVAVVHAHPPVATALTLAGYGMTEPVLPELVMALGGIPTAPYATPGTREGADAIRAVIRTCDAVLLDRHGAVTVGDSVLAAYMKMEKLEHSAGVIHHALTLGRRLPQLRGEELARIFEARRAYGAKGPLWPGLRPEKS
jgi:L-fuculose-phosphate aldolase